ncbi:hypothetical protein BH11MYX3_BH11MYX3_02610 [soil metagenome]
MPERRQHERFELLAGVQLAAGDEVETFVVINISAGGILLRNDSNVQRAVGERIRVTIDAPELTPAFSIDARIVRVVGPTSRAALLAAMWTSSDDAANASLGQILWNLRRP